MCVCAEGTLSLVPALADHKACIHVRIVYSIYTYTFTYIYLYKYKRVCCHSVGQRCPSRWARTDNMPVGRTVSSVVAFYFFISR